MKSDIFNQKRTKKEPKNAMIKVMLKKDEQGLPEELGIFATIKIKQGFRVALGVLAMAALIIVKEAGRS